MGTSFVVFAWAQEGAPVSFGVKGGVPVTDAFNTLKGNEASYVTNTKRYLVGPTFEFHLPLRFSIEFDALYRRLGFDYYQLPGGSVSSGTVANSWQFPLLVKWAVLPGPVRPFLDGGASVQHVSGIEQVSSALHAVGVNPSHPAEFNASLDVGLTVGAGVEFRIGRYLRVSPEMRYTRWGSETFRDPVNALLRTNRNQGDFLLGITF